MDESPTLARAGAVDFDQIIRTSKPIMSIYYAYGDRWPDDEEHLKIDEFTTQIDKIESQNIRILLVGSSDRAGGTQRAREVAQQRAANLNEIFARRGVDVGANRLSCSSAFLL